MKVDKDYCMSSFLMFRRVVDKDTSFADSVLPPRTISYPWERLPIHNSDQLLKHLKEKVEEATADGKAALALSGGIDSAILAKLMPKGSTAYTFKCTVGGGSVIDETPQAAAYAKECGLIHKVVEISWDDMKSLAPVLMRHKRAPLHSIEVQIYKAGLQAKADGFTKMIYGENADGNYGGMSMLLSRDWSVGEFIERYAYVKPWFVLKSPKVDFSPFIPFQNDGYIDVHRFMSEFFVIESLNSYINANETAGMEFVAPFADTFLAEPLDYTRIRNGENKYIVREIFKRLYPDFKVPPKTPMPRPTEQWLKDWAGPSRPEFIPNCVKLLSGDAKWLCWSLERFLDMIDQENQ